MYRKDAVHERATISFAWNSSEKLPLIEQKLRSEKTSMNCIAFVWKSVLLKIDLKTLLFKNISDNIIIIKMEKLKTIYLIYWNLKFSSSLIR